MTKALRNGCPIINIMHIEQKYQDWIDAKLERRSPVNKCAEWTEEMQKAFPELTRVRGYVGTSPDAREGCGGQHWWLKTADGTIVDPTASQFSEPINYSEWDESWGDLSKCANCGMIGSYEPNVCSATCVLALARAYDSYLSPAARARYEAEAALE